MKAIAWTIGLATLVQVVMVLAKVTGHVTWGWALVLLPLELLLAAVAATVVLALYAIAPAWGPDDFEILDGDEDDGKESGDGDR